MARSLIKEFTLAGRAQICHFGGMKWILYTIAIIAVLIGAIFLVGYAFPARTTISRSISLKQSPAAVFAVLADLPHLAGWNRNTEKVEMLPPVNGKEASKQTFKGGMVMTIVTTESVPPHHLVRAIGDDTGPYVGTWTYEISPAEGGCKVVLTEVAEIKNPLFRVMTRVFGQTKYIDEHLQDLAKKFDETATIR